MRAKKKQVKEQNKMTDTKTITATVQSWSDINTGTKKDNTAWASVKLNTVEGSKMTFFGESINDITRDYIEAAPANMLVTYDVRQNGQYWNVIAGTFKVLKGAPATTQTTPASVTQTSNEKYWQGKTDQDKLQFERMQENDPFFVLKDIVCAVTAKSELNINDADKLSVQINTIMSVSTELLDGCLKKKEELAKAKHIL